MLSFSSTAKWMIALILIIIASNTYSYNLLCDPMINWIATPMSNTFIFNDTACNVKVLYSSNSYEKRLIDVSSIFSNPSNYPLSFTINGIPFADSVQFGIVFVINGAGFWGYTETTSNPLQIMYEWESPTDELYDVYLNGDLSSMGYMGQHTASNIIQIGFNVHPLNTDDFIIFDHAELNGLTINSTPNPTPSTSTNPTTSIPTTKPPTTTTPTSYPSFDPSVSPIVSTTKPTYDPTEFPTIYPTMIPTIYIPTTQPSTTTEPTKYPSLHPSVSSTISTSKSTHSVTTLFPTVYPTKLPTIYSTKATLKASTVRPTTYPTRTHLDCDKENGMILVISFDYQLKNNGIGITEDMIDNNLLNVIDNLIDNKNSSLTNCFITDYVIYIDSNINTNRAVINISLCTTCDDIDEIEENIVIDLIDLSNNNGILSVISGTTDIEIDIIKIYEKEAEQQQSTTELLIQTKKSQDDDAGNGSFYIIIGLIVFILCICILSISVYTVYMIRRDKEIERQNTMELQIVNNGGIKAFNTNPMLPVLVPTQSSVRSSGQSSVEGTEININPVIPVLLPTVSSVQSSCDGHNTKAMKTDEDEEHSIDDKAYTQSSSNLKGMRVTPVCIGTITGNAVFDDAWDEKYDDMKNNEMYIRKSIDNMNEEMIKIKSWLETVVRFPQYLDNFIQNGYDRMDVIIEITNKSELKEIGIDLMGHRTKIIAEIKKLQSNHHQVIPVDIGDNDDNINKQSEGQDVVTVYDDNTTGKII